MLTSFLGVSLSLSDFLADGMKVSKTGSRWYIVYIATFLPPLIVVWFYPGAFITALSYAGILCVILLILLPALMAWRGRYTKKIAKGFEVAGGKIVLLSLMLISIVLLTVGIFEDLHIII